MGGQDRTRTEAGWHAPSHLGVHLLGAQEGLRTQWHASSQEPPPEGQGRSAAEMLVICIYARGHPLLETREQMTVPVLNGEST